jgi:hypothetical protein
MAKKTEAKKRTPKKPDAKNKNTKSLGPSIEDVRARQRDAKRATRRAQSVVAIRKCKDKEFRELAESDIYEWLRFFGEGSGEFSRPFTDQQRIMIQAILHAITNGGDQSIAAPRGEGKTSICEWVLMYAVLTGLCNFAVLFSATGADAEANLESIRQRFEENDILADYYPEVCDPIRALEGTAQRAKTQTVTGFRHDTGEPFVTHPTKFSWCGREVMFPNVPGSKAAKARIATRGLDAAVKGMKRGAMRPQVAVIDDPDTDETANSEDQAAKLEKKIDRNIAGLGGQKRMIGRVMLTTIPSRRSVSFKFTDRTQKPSFKGQRFPFLVAPPTCVQLWEDYVALRKIDWDQGTTAANEMYASKRSEMDAGAVVCNEWRRGEDSEISALQCYFNAVARWGQEAVDSEWQNNPSEDSGPVESGITPFRILKKLSGFGHREIPPGCTILSQGIDVGKRYLHWVVRAWKPDGETGYTIDYGIQQVYGVVTGSEEGLDDALRESLCQRMEDFRTCDYATADGQKIRDSMTLVDARYRTSAIYMACDSLGLGIRPVMGYGKSAGCVRANFNDVSRRTPDRKPGGDGWFESKQHIGNGRSIWLVNIDADKWKAWEHDRWMTAPDKPGCMWLYGTPGDDPKRITGDELEHQRRHYPAHICAEVEVEETIDGIVKKYWKAKGENHWLDSSSYCDAAAHMVGGSLHGSTGVRRKKATDDHEPTARELAAQSRRG